MSTFLRPESFTQIDLFADVFIEVVGGRGLPAFSVAEVARWARMTPQAVLQAIGGRDAFVVYVADAVARRWTAWATQSVSGLPVALPLTDEERMGVRAWGALVELARAEDACGRHEAAQVVAQAWTREQTAYAWRFETTHHLLPEELDALTCLLVGVRGAMARLVEPMPPERGAALVDAWLAQAGKGKGHGAA